MPLKRYDQLFPHVGRFVPVPALVIEEAVPLGISSNDLHVLLLLLSKSYTRKDWPVVPMTWRQLAKRTGRSVDAARRAARALEAADVVHVTRGTGRQVNRFDLWPLLLRLAILHDATSAYAWAKRQERNRTEAVLHPQLVLAGLESVHGFEGLPGQTLVDDVLHRARKAGRQVRDPYPLLRAVGD